VETREGLSVEKAFELAVLRLGQPAKLGREFDKIGKGPCASERARRIIVVERGIMLPIKAVVALLLFQSFFGSNWFLAVLSPKEVAVQFVQQAAWGYLALSLLMAAPVLAARRVPLSWLHGATFTASLADSLFLGLLCLLTGGYFSAFYWLFPALILRNSVSLPRPGSQILLNGFAIGCYALSGITDLWFRRFLGSDPSQLGAPVYVAPLGTEQVAVRVMLLVLAAACSLLGQAALSRQPQRPPTAHAA
jgi:hypothetical protein